MLKRLIVSAALVGSALVAPASVGLASATTAHAPTAVVAAACTYQRSGNHWNCVTPGAYCPKAAHTKYGYAKVTNRKYKCSVYSNGQWRWKRI